MEKFGFRIEYKQENLYEFIFWGGTRTQDGIYGTWTTLLAEMIDARKYLSFSFMVTDLSRTIFFKSPRTW